MAERTRGKKTQDSDLDSLKDALAAMLNCALEEQRVFIKNNAKEQRAFTEGQFAKLEHKLEQFGADIAKNSEDIKQLKDDQLSTEAQLQKLSDTSNSTWAKMEATIAELEDRSRRDNIRIINLTERVETSDMRAYLVAALQQWFPGLSTGSMEIMRAHCIGPERGAKERIRTVIYKMLRFTDCDTVLRAAQGKRIEVAGREIRFAVDFSNFTARRRREFAPSMDTARKLGFHAFLIYPARLKLARGSEVHFFNNFKDADEFLKSCDKG